MSGRKVVTIAVINGRRVDCVAFIQGKSIHIHYLVAKTDLVAWQPDYPLDEVLAGVHRVVEDHDVSTLDVSIR